MNTSGSSVIPVISDPLVFLMEITNMQIGLIIPYGLLFLFGTSKNLYVICVLCKVLYYGGRGGHSRHLFMYILCLSAVDLMVLSNLLFIITDTALTTWIFGKFLCWYFYTMENLSKTLSVFLLTTMAIDRFLVVCMSNAGRAFRSDGSVAITLLVCIVVAACLLFPLPYYSAVLEAPPYNTTFFHPPYDNVTVTVIVHKCFWLAPGKVQLAFTYYTFTLCFLIPGMIIFVLYTVILGVLRRHAAQNRNSSLPLRKLSFRIAILQLFYFSCWTPYWVSNLNQGLGDTTTVRIIVSYVCHALPYLNSAVNPIFYGLLNREFRRGYEESRVIVGHRKSNVMLARSSRNRTGAARLAVPDIDEPTNSPVLQTTPLFVYEVTANNNVLPYPETCDL